MENLLVLGAKIIAIYAVITRIIEAVLEWWSTNKDTVKNFADAVKALWQIIRNFIGVELYKEKK